MVVTSSLFLLSNEQKEITSIEGDLRNFLPFLRHQYMDTPLAKSLLIDAFYYFYLEETPLINAEMELLFPFRKYFVHELVFSKKFKRIRQNTVGSFPRSMIAGASCVNLLIDFFKQIQELYSVEELNMLFKFVGNAEVLYQNVTTLDELPKDLVLAEKKAVMLLSDYWHTQEEQLQRDIMEIVKLIDSLVINERLLFQHL